VRVVRDHIEQRVRRLMDDLGVEATRTTGPADRPAG
jgi:hypothetical protein